MIKKTISLSILCILTSSLYGDGKHFDENKLSAAIKDVDKDSVVLLLAEHSIKDSASKKRLLTTAKESVEECKKSLSVFRSRPDVAAYVGGAGLCLYGGKGLITLLLSLSEEGRTWKVAKSLASLGVGSYLLKRGWNLTSGYAFLEDAIHIHDILLGAPVAS
ncbi:hypothetical protein H0W26_01760 [Candidatus Dependentiae bacterium]|nr:hypothetical protein [Candidatus Dependentiae bacterium]